MTSNSPAVWTVGMGAGISHSFLSFWLFFFLSSLPSHFHSVLPRHQCTLIIFQTATSLSVCFGKGLHTQRTVCLNFNQTRFTLLAVIMTDSRKGSPSTWLRDDNTYSSIRVVPRRSLLLLSGGVGVFPNAPPRPPCPICSHRKPRRGWPVGGEYDNTLQRKWAQCSGM